MKNHGEMQSDIDELNYVTTVAKNLKQHVRQERAIRKESAARTISMKRVDNTDSFAMTTKRERGEGSLYLRNGIWWLSYYDSGRRIRVTSGTANEKKARKFLNKKTGGILNNIHGDSRSLRYEDIRDAFYAECELNKKDHKSLRIDSKGNLYFESVRRLDKFFANRRIVDIDSALIREFKKKLHKDGCANGTTNRSVAALRRMFTLAAEEGVIHNLPVFKMMEEAEPRKGTLAHEKYDALREELPEHLRPVLIAGFCMGARLGEILGLKWENINWIQRTLTFVDTKNGESREIVFSSEIEATLRDQFSRRQQGCPYVFFKIDAKGHAHRIGDFRKVWRRICVKLELARWEPVIANGEPVYERLRYQHSKAKPKMRYVGLIFHDLRRTFITDAEDAGAPRHEVMAISGHKSESTYKRYAISNKKQQRAAMNTIEGFRKDLSLQGAGNSNSENFGHAMDTKTSLDGHVEQ
jgi:integrase